MTIHWKAVEQHVPVVLFVFQLYPACNCCSIVRAQDHGHHITGQEVEQIVQIDEVEQMHSKGINVSSF